MSAKICYDAQAGACWRKHETLWHLPCCTFAAGLKHLSQICMELQGAQLTSMTLFSFLLWALFSSLSHCTVSCSSRSGSASCILV